MAEQVEPGEAVAVEPVAMTADTTDSNEQVLPPGPPSEPSPEVTT